MRSWMLASVLAAALGGGLLAPAPVEAASRHGGHGHYAPRHGHSYGGYHHGGSYYRPYYRSHYRSYYRPYNYYAPPAYYYGSGPYAYGYGYGYGYGPRYCPRPSVGIGFYFGY